MDTRLFDYVDASGTQWIMAACGHRCGGGVSLGDKIAACPNCRLLLAVVGRVPVVYPERLPTTMAPEEPSLRRTQRE
jgi:hypothetical protein